MQIQSADLTLGRRQLLKYAGIGAAAIAGSSVLAGCTGSGSAAPRRTGGLFIHGATGSSSKDTLDPHEWNSIADAARSSNLYESLLFWNNDYKLEPALAESVEASSDAKTWTIRMRQGVTFHNGKDVTAMDAWASIQRVANPKKPLPPGTQLSRILDFESSKLIDRTTLKLVLKTPYAVLDYLLAELNIAPADFDINNPVGTGAFAYKSFDPGKTSTFTRYANYWGQAAFVDELQIQNFADDNAKVNALQAGQIQTLDNLPSSLVETVKGAGNGVLTAQTGGWTPFTMRVDASPFSDVRVRQAMRLIVDRQAMIDQVLNGYGSLGNDLYAPFDPAFASELPQREQDIEQAKSLLKSAGQEGLQVQLVTGNDIGPAGPASANLFAEQAKLAGVDVKVTNKPSFYDNDYLSYPFAQDSWSTRQYLPQAAFCTMPGAAYNETHFQNQKYVDLINTAAATVDEAKRTTLLKDAQEIEYNEGGYIIWGFKTQLDAYASNVQGLEPSKFRPVGSFKFNKVSV